MNKLILTKKGLIYQHVRGAESFSANVSNRAHEYLYEAVEIAPGVLLRDFFEFVIKCPTLRAIHARDYTFEYVEQYKQIKELEKAQGVAQNTPKAYLEVYSHWEHNSSLGVIYGTSLPYLRVCYMINPDTQDTNTFAPQESTAQYLLQDMLDMPLMLNDEVIMTESDQFSTNFMKTSLRANATISLGMLCRAIFWELSSMGSPEEREAEIAQDYASMDDQYPDEYDGCDETIDNDPQASFDAMVDDTLKTGGDALYSMFGLKDPVSRFFDIHGKYNRFEIDLFLQKIEDKQVMRDVEIPGHLNISLKPEFNNLSARDFREELGLYQVS